MFINKCHEIFQDNYSTIIGIQEIHFKENDAKRMAKFSSHGPLTALVYRPNLKCLNTSPNQFAFTLISVLRDKFRLEPEDQGVERGGVARFICSPPKGMPTPTVFWKKNGKFIDLEKEERYVMICKILFVQFS